MLFPIEQTSAKIRRYLATPEQVLAQLSRISPSLNEEAPRFDLLYGLMNLDQGTLLVAGIGNWRMVLAQPGVEPAFFEVSGVHNDNVRQGMVLYQGVIAPGSRLYLYSQECAQTLGIADFQVWKKHVLQTERGSESLNKEFSRLLSLGREDPPTPGDSALLGIQWRESFDVERISPSPSQLQQSILELSAISLNLKDEFCTHGNPLLLGSIWIASLSTLWLTQSTSVKSAARCVILWKVWPIPKTFVTTPTWWSQRP